MNITRKDIERFEQSYTPVTESGCWLWDGMKGHGSYGHFKFEDKTGSSAHRASWIIHSGPIPDGLHVLHKCDVQGCVRPDHLHLGTHRDNMRAAIDRGRMNNRPLSAAHKANISASKKGERHPNYGKQLSAETRAKISAANKGKSRPCTEKTKAKIAEATKKQWENQEIREKRILGLRKAKRKQLQQEERR